MDDEGRDQLFKADASDEGCLNIHLLITQMESVCLPYDEDRQIRQRLRKALAGVDSAGQGRKKEEKGLKKKICERRNKIPRITFIKKWLLDFLSRLQNSC